MPALVYELAHQYFGTNGNIHRGVTRGIKGYTALTEGG